MSNRGAVGPMHKQNDCSIYLYFILFLFIQLSSWIGGLNHVLNLVLLLLTTIENYIFGSVLFTICLRRRFCNEKIIILCVLIWYVKYPLLYSPLCFVFQVIDHQIPLHSFSLNLVLYRVGNISNRLIKIALNIRFVTNLFRHFFNNWYGRNTQIRYFDLVFKQSNNDYFG